MLTRKFYVNVNYHCYCPFMMVMINNVNQATQVYLTGGSSNSQNVFHRTILKLLRDSEERKGRGESVVKFLEILV